MTPLRLIAVLWLILATASCSMDSTREPGGQLDVPLKHETAPASQPEKLSMLTDQAELLAAEGNLEQAIATTERVLRLEPQNPDVWYRLAKLHIQKGDFASAEEYAMRTLKFARDRRDMQAKAWRLIERARFMVGNMAGARHAAERAEKLEDPGNSMESLVILSMS